MTWIPTLLSKLLKLADGFKLLGRALTENDKLIIKKINFAIQIQFVFG